MVSMVSCRYFQLSIVTIGSTARTSKQLLARYARKDQSLTVQVIDAEHDEPIELPAGAVTLRLDILETMASGQCITLIPEDGELTTVQAADILHVSRPFLIKLLDEGKSPTARSANIVVSAWKMS